MRLTPNFDLDEFVISQEAVRRDIDNTPSAAIVQNLQDLCDVILEPLRAALGPVVVTSGYRCPELNRAIGGTGMSQHMEGRAADIHIPGHSLEEVFNYIYQNLHFDQVIHEFGRWIHVSYDPARSRRQGLIALKEDEKTIYKPQGIFT